MDDLISKQAALGKKYDIIYSDPPWSQKKGNLRKCRPNQTKDLDYPTLTVEEIKEIHECFFKKL